MTQLFFLLQSCQYIYALSMSYKCQLLYFVSLCAGPQFLKRTCPSTLQKMTGSEDSRTPVRLPLLSSRQIIMEFIHDGVELYIRCLYYLSRVFLIPKYMDNFFIKLICRQIFIEFGIAINLCHGWGVISSFESQLLCVFVANVLELISDIFFWEKNAICDLTV